MSKKLMMLAATALMMQATPVFADNHGGPDGERGKHKGKMFEMHDTDGDGVVTKDEFLSHAEERFGKMDADGDGKITKEESAEAHKAMKEKFKEKRKEFKERRGGPDGDAPEEPSDE